MTITKYLTCAAFLSVAAIAQADTQLSISTGGTGGVFYPLGGGIAEIINRHVDGYSATAEVTGASVENISLIATGDTDMAIVNANVAVQAFEGTDRFEGHAVDQLRAIGTLYANMIQIVAMADSGINSLADLKGKRVSIGAPGSGAEVSSNEVLSSNTISYDDIDEQRLNFNETAEALGNGDIDVGIWSVGAPTSSILNLATVHSIKIVPLTDAEIAAVIANYPIYARTTLDAGVYDGVDEAVPTLGIANLLVVSDEMSADEVYTLTKAIYDNVEELRAVHPAANQTTIAVTLEATPLPLHPGAIRYFEEMGAQIPDRLRP